MHRLFNSNTVQLFFVNALSSSPAEKFLLTIVHLLAAPF